VPKDRVYIEAGSKRVFAGAIEWPGWCRSGRDEAAALDALAAYGKRYKRAMRRAAGGFVPPADASSLRVVERVAGGATTDFGAPGVAPEADERRLGGDELARQTRLLRAAWAAFDRAAQAHAGVELRRGPRGGGRQVDAMVAHVLDADRAYLSGIGGTFAPPKDADAAVVTDGVRRAMIDALGARARNEPPPPSRRRSPLWTPRYCVRRSAWHALDHAWEIEDRASPEPAGP
jgi:hypothetical protein